MAAQEMEHTALGLRPPASGSQLLPFPAMVAVPLLALLAAPCCPLAKQDGGRLFLLQRLRRRIWSRRQRELLSRAIIAAWRKRLEKTRRIPQPDPVLLFRTLGSALRRLP